MTLSSLSNFITTHLGRMKAWAACNSLDYMLSSPLPTCVHCISRIMDPSSCLHTKCTCTLWRPRWNIHWYRQLFDWFDTLLHYLFSIKNRLGFWSPNQNYWCLVSPPCFFPATAPCGLRIAQMSGQKVAVRAHEKLRGWGTL